MNQKKIGVLGGIGPEATAEFYSKLITRLQQSGAITKNTDFPNIIINSIPAPELIYDAIPDEDLEHYAEGLKELDKISPQFIVMVCNTIHLYHSRLKQNISTPILDLRQELKKKLDDQGIRSTLVIGTPGTIRQGLYRFDGIQCITPDEDEMKTLTESIFLFNKGMEKDIQKAKAYGICRKYLNQGAQTVILGCTEFSVMLKDEPMPKINTIDVLVDSTAKRLYPESILN